MAEPPDTSAPYLDKYQADVVSGTWIATGIFTGIAYGSGLLLRPIAPKTAGKVASLGSSTHLPHANEFKGSAYPRAGLLTIFNALPAPGWIVPPEVFGLSPGYIVSPGEFGPETGKLLHLAGIEPTQERVDQFRSIEADKISRFQSRIAPALSVDTLKRFHATVNTPEFQAANPNARTSELSAIYFGELLKRKVLDVPPASEFEKGLLFHATPKNNTPTPTPGIAPTPTPMPALLPMLATTINNTPESLFDQLAISARNAPDTFTPANQKAKDNADAASGLRRILATERFDP